MKKILLALLLCLPLVSTDLPNCKLILVGPVREELIPVKSVNGWIRVLRSEKKSEKYQIDINNKEKKIIIKKLQDCYDTSSIGRMQ